jgi:predicted enzyme involved in methoxymalonyl-ACP biosynthesis
LIGEYIPTSKNALVREHYAKLGFTVVHQDETGYSRAVLDLSDCAADEHFMSIEEG